MNGFRVVLLGVIGSGKTTLFNKLTSNNEPARAGGPSITNQIVEGYSHLKEYLQIVDTPGFNVNSEKVLHAAGVIAALTDGDLNRILIIQKFERDDIMVNSLKQIIAPINRYRDIITIIVSHWDISEDKQQDGIQIKKKIYDNFNIRSVLFYSKQEDPLIITDSILQIIEEQKNITVKLTDAEIYSQFDLLSLDDASSIQLDHDKHEIIKEFRKISFVFSKYIKEKIKLGDPQAVDILHCISLEIKKIGNWFVEDFEKRNGDEINKYYETNTYNVKYLHHIYLKKEIAKEIEHVIKQAQEKMIKSKHHFFEFLKQCPNCKLIWMKVIGCNYQTTCGNRVNQNREEILKKSSSLNLYKIKIQQGQLIVEKNIQQEIPLQQQKITFMGWLYELVENDQNFKNILGEQFTQDQFINILYNKIGGMSYYSLKMTYSLGLMQNNENRMIQQLYKMFNIIQVRDNNIKYFGCGQTLVWKDLPPLSGPELNELLTTELIDYFSDYEQLIKEEYKLLEKQYKDQINQAIMDQKKNKKILRKQ